MTTTITVKTKIRVNGHDYTSVEDMPQDVRWAYERALAAVTGGRHGGPPSIHNTSVATASSAKIIFNGQEYRSVEEMPAELRRLYDGVVATLDANEAGHGRRIADTCLQPASVVVGAAIRSEYTGSRLVIAGVLIAALLLASFVFGR